MNNKFLRYISPYLSNFDQILSCSKQFTLGRWYNLRCKNKVYFRDTTIKVINCKDINYHCMRCKEIWYKEGKQHRDDKDPETGLTLPTLIWEYGTHFWYKEGKLHRDDKDPETGLTLPAVIDADGSQEWYKDGRCHRDDIDPETGLTLPALIWADGREYWYREGSLQESPSMAD